MAEWLVTSIGQLCDEGLAEIQTGPFGSQLHAYEYVPAGISVVPTEAIRARRIDYSVLPKIRKEKAHELKRHRLIPGDILFARRGVQATGHTAYVRDEEEGFICGTGAIRLRIKPPIRSVLPEFLSHVFANPASVNWFKFHAIGATMPNLNEGIICSFPLVLPPIVDQQAIAILLSALDDKIDLNRRINETLEAMARVIFKDWFVNFGPTRAKAEGRLPYLAPALWSLFLDALDDDDKPMGWSNRRLGDIIELAYGKALKAEDRKPGAISVFGSNGQVGLHNEALVKGPGVVVGRKGNPGTVNYIQSDFFPIDTTFYVVPKGHVRSQAFLWLMIDGLNLPNLSADSAVPGLNREIAYSAECIMPPPSLVDAFDELITPLLGRLAHNSKENETLCQLRDLLLPKLMSGEIRLHEAEKLVGEGVWAS